MKNPAVDNVACIVEAINQHNARCLNGRAVAVVLHPIEIERMGWDDGDTLAGCELRADPSRPTGTFKVVCAAEDPGDGETAAADHSRHITDDRPRVGERVAA